MLEEIEGDELRIVELFPALSGTGFEFSSPRTLDYNCLSWALGESDVKWDPGPGYYWPEGMPRNGRMDTLITILKSQQFEVCDQGSEVESGYEKIVILHNWGEWTHVARQLPDGRWTSKIGNREDITHDTADDLVGDEYGQIACYMKRKSMRRNEADRKNQSS